MEKVNQSIWKTVEINTDEFNSTCYYQALLIRNTQFSVTVNLHFIFYSNKFNSIKTLFILKLYSIGGFPINLQRNIVNNLYSMSLHECIASIFLT